MVILTETFERLKAVYPAFLMFISITITSLIAIEEVEFLMQVFDKWALQKAWFLAGLNALVPLVVSSIQEESRIKRFFYYKLPIFILGFIVLLTASYNTISKYIDQLSDAYSVQERLTDLEAQIVRNEGLLLLIKDQPVNTAVTVRKIQALEQAKLQIQPPELIETAETIFIILVLTIARVVLWISAVLLFQHGAVLISKQGAGTTRESFDDVGISTTIIEENEIPLPDVSIQNVSLAEEIRRLIESSDINGELLITTDKGQEKVFTGPYLSVLKNHSAAFIQALSEAKLDSERIPPEVSHA